MCYEQNIDRDSSLETETFLQMKVLPNLLSWFHHTVECLKTLRFIVTCYIETSNHNLYLPAISSRVSQQNNILARSRGFPNLSLSG